MLFRHLQSDWPCVKTVPLVSCTVLTLRGVGLVVKEQYFCASRIFQNARDIQKVIHRSSRTCLGHCFSIQGPRTLCHTDRIRRLYVGLRLGLGLTGRYVIQYSIVQSERMIIRVLERAREHAAVILLLDFRFQYFDEIMNGIQK